MLKITLCFGKMILEFARLNLEKDLRRCFFSCRMYFILILLQLNRIVLFNFAFLYKLSSSSIIPAIITSLLPSFIGLSKTQAAARAESLGLNYEFVGDGETVIDQSYPEKKRIDKIGKNKLVLTLNQKVVIEEDDDDDEDEEEKEDSDKDTSKEDKPTTETPKTDEPSTPSTSTETE